MVLLAQAEATLRELDDRPLLPTCYAYEGLSIFCVKTAAAQAALSEAEQVAGSMNAGTASTLNRAMERLRTAIAVGPHCPSNFRARRAQRPAAAARATVL